MNNNILHTIKINSETKRMIVYLVKHKIKHADIIREAIHEPLRQKCKEMKYRESNEYYPF